MEQSPIDNPQKNWLEQVKQEVQKLLTEDYDNLMKGVVEEKKVMYAEMKNEAIQKLHESTPTSFPFI